MGKERVFLGGADADSNDKRIHQLAGTLDDIEMAVGERVERPWIKPDQTAHALPPFLHKLVSRGSAIWQADGAGLPFGGTIMAWGQQAHEHILMVLIDVTVDHGPATQQVVGPHLGLG